jgi:hypothetical protein
MILMELTGRSGAKIVVHFEAVTWMEPASHTSQGDFATLIHFWKDHGVYVTETIGEITSLLSTIEGAR